MFLLVGLLYERTHTRNIQDYSSLVQVMPRFALFMTLTLLAAMGLPGSVGFIAELHTLIGGFQQWSGLMVFSAWYSDCGLCHAHYRTFIYRPGKATNAADCRP